MKEEDAVSSELRSCVKVEVAVLDAPSLISLMVSVDVKHHERRSLQTAPLYHGRRNKEKRLQRI